MLEIATEFIEISAKKTSLVAPSHKVIFFSPVHIPQNEICEVYFHRTMKSNRFRWLGHWRPLGFVMNYGCAPATAPRSLSATRKSNMVIVCSFSCNINKFLSRQDFVLLKRGDGNVRAHIYIERLNAEPD